MTREDYKHQLQIAIIANGLQDLYNAHGDIKVNLDNLLKAVSDITQKATDKEFGEQKEQRGMAEMKDSMQKSTSIFGDK